MREFLRSFTCQRYPAGLRVWSAGPFDVAERLQEILRHLRQPAGTGVEPLKQSDRRAVLRVRENSGQTLPLVIKGFPLRKLESRIKYQKYGLSEFRHYQQATRLGIATPHCHAYFEVRSFGLVTANGVILEDLRGWSSLAELAAQEPAQRSEPLAQAIPLLHQLYETGVNHIDPSPQNMLLSPTGHELRLIDWQYCSFLPPGQPAQLVFQAAHFLTYAACPAESPEGRVWLERLWATAGHAASFENFLRAVSSLQQGGRLGATQRLALALDERTARALAVLDLKSPRHRLHPL